MTSLTALELLSIESLNPLIAPVKNLVGNLELILGIFGLYMIFAIIQAYYAKRKDKLLKDILSALKDIESKIIIVKSKKK